MRHVIPTYLWEAAPLQANAYLIRKIKSRLKWSSSPRQRCSVHNVPVALWISSSYRWYAERWSVVKLVWSYIHGAAGPLRRRQFARFRATAGRPLLPQMFASKEHLCSFQMQCSCLCTLAAHWVCSAIITEILKCVVLFLLWILSYIQLLATALC